MKMLTSYYALAVQLKSAEGGVIIEGNRELIRIYEEKVKKIIERVWVS
jgi:hypothetical protein